MLIHQISVFIENRSGRLSEVMGVLAEANVDLRAVSLADTSDFGILRMIVNDPELTVQRLKDSGFTASVTEVLAAELDDKPGALHKVLSVLTEADISVEYIYAFITRKNENAYVIMRVEDKAGAVKVLREHGVPLLSPKEVYGI